MDPSWANVSPSNSPKDAANQMVVQPALGLRPLRQLPPKLSRKTKKPGGKEKEKLMDNKMCW